MTIYEKMVQAGVKIENHCSDMYVPKNAITDQIVADYEFPAMVSVFRDNIDHKLWYNISFAFDPWWNLDAKTYYKNKNRVYETQWDTDN